MPTTAQRLALVFAALLAAGLLPEPAQAEQLQLKCPYGRNSLGAPSGSVAALIVVDFDTRTMTLSYVDEGENKVSSLERMAADISDDRIAARSGPALRYVLNRYTGALSTVIDNGPSVPPLQIAWMCERYERGTRRF